MFSDPEHNIEQAILSPGMHIADFGSGTGFYSLAAAHQVKKEGRVYAIDVQKDLLARLTDAASQEGLTNIEVIWGDLEHVGGSTLRDDMVEMGIIANIYFQIEDKKTFLKEVYRTVRPAGRVLFVDWTDSFGGLGPQPGHIVAEKTAEKDLTDAGFVLERRIDAGAHHYGFIMTKK